MTVESTDYVAAGEKVTFGNRVGRNFLEDHHDLRETIRGWAAGRSLKSQVVNLQIRVKDPTKDARGYREIGRHRFLEVYRRDALDWSAVDGPEIGRLSDLGKRHMYFVYPGHEVRYLLTSVHRYVTYIPAV
jgi:hypothetical protein